LRITDSAAAVSGKDELYRLQTPGEEEPLKRKDKGQKEKKEEPDS
jgi:hypothetical protein